MAMTLAKQEATLKLAQALGPLRASQARWSELPFLEKAKVLEKIAEQIESLAADFARRDSEESFFETDFLLQRNYLAGSHFFERQAQALKEFKEEVSFQYQPLGIVGLLLPKCLPFRFACEHIASALAAGNAVIVKVSSSRPEVAKILAEVFKNSELPEGLVEVFIGSGQDLGQVLVQHPSISSIALAGREEVVKEVSQQCLQRQKKFFAEVSSKNTLILVEGWQQQDFQKVMESVSHGWGQTGWNTNKIFVLEAHYAEFKEKLKNWMSRFHKIHLMDNDVAWEKVEEMYQKLQGESGRSLLPWHKGLPLFLENVTNCSLSQQESIQLPVVLVNVVKYPHEIQKWTDNQDTGFKAVIRGQVEKALGVAKKIKFGSIEINSWLDPAADQHLGLKNSFVGIPEKDWNSRRFNHVKNLVVR